MAKLGMQSVQGPRVGKAKRKPVDRSSFGYQLARAAAFVAVFGMCIIFGVFILKGCQL